MINIIIGIIIGLFICFVIISIINNIKRKGSNELYEDYNKLEPLVDLLIDRQIIKDGVKYLIDVNNYCVYVFNNNELKQYFYKNNNIMNGDIIIIPENIIKILGDYINWNYCYGLNSLYCRSINFINKIRKKK